MSRFQTAAARILLGLVFFGIVILKLWTITSTPNGYIQYQIELGQLGLPGIFAPSIILIQFIGGLFLTIGYQTKASAITLALLSVFTAVIAALASIKFQQPLISFNSFFLYMGIAGGMLLLSAHPNTSLSVDNLRNKV